MLNANFAIEIILLRKLIYNNKIMNKAIFPGSFDPFHIGHKFIIDQALKDFDYLYIVISWNENKNRRDSFFNSKREIKKQLKKYKNIKIIINKKRMMVEVAKKLNCFDFVRGIRNDEDKQYEEHLLKQYQKQEPKIRIKYYYSPNYLQHISSSNK